MVVQYLKNNCFNFYLCFLRFKITNIFQGLEVQSKRRRLENTPLKLRLRYFDRSINNDYIILLLKNNFT